MGGEKVVVGAVVVGVAVVVGATVVTCAVVEAWVSSTAKDSGVSFAKSAATVVRVISAPASTNETVSGTGSTGVSDRATTAVKPKKVPPGIR